MGDGVITALGYRGKSRFVSSRLEKSRTNRRNDGGGLAYHLNHGQRTQPPIITFTHAHPFLANHPPSKPIRFLSANTRHRTYVVLRMGHRLRRRPNIEPTQVQRLVLAGISVNQILKSPFPARVSILIDSFIHFHSIEDRGLEPHSGLQVSKKQNVSSPLTCKACSASDRRGSNSEPCVWGAVSSHSSHLPQDVLLPPV